MRISRLKLSRKKNTKRYLVAPYLLLLSRFRYLFLAISALFVVVMTGLFIHLGYVTDWIEKASVTIAHLTGRFGYQFRDVYIQGRIFTSTHEILQAIRMHQGEPTFKYAPHAIKERLEHIPWVVKAEVRRELPGALHIHLTERTPIALWQHQQRFYLVDEDGTVIQSSVLKQFENLPVVVGQDAPQQIPKLLSLLKAYQEITSRLTGIIRVSKRRWDLILGKNLTIKLPETQLEAALARLSFLLESRKINLEEITVIDLRLSRQLIAKVAPHTAARLKLKSVEA